MIRLFERGDLVDAFKSPEQIQRELLQARCFKDLRHLMPEEREAFIRRIKSAWDTARVVIHPYYEKYVRPDDYQLQSEFVGDTLKRMVRANFSGSSEIKPPIIIFEEAERISETQASLQDALLTVNDQDREINPVYFMPTFPRTSQPQFMEKRSSKDFPKLINLFDDLKIRKIILGGMFLMTPQHRNSRNQAQGCVNYMRDVLMDGNFEVEISNFAYPATRQDKDQIDRVIED